MQNVDALSWAAFESGSSAAAVREKCPPHMMPLIATDHEPHFCVARDPLHCTGAPSGWSGSTFLSSRQVAAPRSLLFLQAHGRFTVAADADAARQADASDGAAPMRLHLLRAE